MSKPLAFGVGLPKRPARSRGVASAYSFRSRHRDRRPRPCRAPRRCRAERRDGSARWWPGASGTD